MFTVFLISFCADFCIGVVSGIPDEVLGCTRASGCPEISGVVSIDGLNGAYQGLENGELVAFPASSSEDNIFNWTAITSLNSGRVTGDFNSAPEDYCFQLSCDGESNIVDIDFSIGVFCDCHSSLLNCQPYLEEAA